MNSPDRNPQTAEEPSGNGRETLRPTSVNPDPASDESAGGGTVPMPMADAEHGPTKAHDPDHYRPL